LPAGGSCLLGSLNLSEFVVDGHFDYNSFKEAINVATIALNDVLDEGIELLPLEEQKKSVSEYRQIGLGVFGLADMFIKLKIRYGSPESLEVCKVIASHLINYSIASSAMIAKEKGSYPKYSQNIIFNSDFFNANINADTKELVKKHGLRNSQLLTCAPTGTLSTMIGVSGGIEPIFSYSYDRRTQSLHGEDVIYKVYTPIVGKYMEENLIEDESKLPDFFNNAMMLDYKERVEMQSVWQQFIDASISSTVNLPEETTIEDVIELYKLEWQKNLKGITIYRNNCSRQGILTIDKKEEENTQELNPASKWNDLPEDIAYYKRKLKTGCGKLNLFIGYSQSDGKVHDLYAIRSGQGGCEKSVQTTIIAMAGMLRLGGNIFNIEKAFNGTGGCNSFLLKRAKGEALSKGSSCGTAVLFEIKAFLKEKELGESTNTLKKHKEQFSKEEKVIVEKTAKSKQLVKIKN